MARSPISPKTSMALAITGMVLAAGPAIAQTVGKAAAVNPASTASGRTLTLGSEIIHKERVQTSASGSLQLLFLDRTTLNIGPNSELVIDEYVFDPRTNTGKMSLSLGKGLMRFVGGQISHDGNASVKTPNATIGIRGAVGSFSFDPKTKLTSASNDCKDCTITLLAPNGQLVSIPGGFTATVGSDGKITLAPTSQQDADKKVKETQSKGKQTGGAGNNTSNNAANYNPSNSNYNPAPPPPPGATGGGPGTGNEWVIKNTIQTQQTTTGNNAAAGSSPPPPPPPYGPL